MSWLYEVVWLVADARDD